MQYYRDMVRSVPQVKPTKVTADTAAAKANVDSVKRALGGLQNKRVRVDVDKHTNQYYHGSLLPTNNKTANGQTVYRVIRPDGTPTNNMAWNKGGIVPGFAGGGLIPGQSPTDPSVDNRFATVDGKGMIQVRSGEFIVKQPAVDYWGLDFFKQLNNMKMPAFNAGGSIGGGRGGSGSAGPLLVELTAENIAAIQRMPQIALYADSTEIARSANKGNAILATQGAN